MSEHDRVEKMFKELHAAQMKAKRPGFVAAPVKIPGLKPCPCCGNEATWPDASKAYVYCASCGLSFSTHWYNPDDVAGVYSAWNKRVAK